MTTPPAGFWPKVRPKGLSTSTSIVLEAPAVLADRIWSPLRGLPEKSPFSATNQWDTKTPFLASWTETPWKALFWTHKKRNHATKRKRFRFGSVESESESDTWGWGGAAEAEGLGDGNRGAPMEVLAKAEEPATTADDIFWDWEREKKRLRWRCGDWGIHYVVDLDTPTPNAVHCLLPLARTFFFFLCPTLG